jgi:hypothetical protein
MERSNATTELCVKMTLVSLEHLCNRMMCSLKQWLLLKPSSLLANWEPHLMRKILSRRSIRLLTGWVCRTARKPELVLSDWRDSQEEKGREHQLVMNLLLIPDWCCWMSLLVDWTVQLLSRLWRWSREKPRWEWLLCAQFISHPVTFSPLWTE